MWLTASGLRVTAEEACDDWVVALTGRRRGYAEELLAWAEAGATGTLGCAQRGRPLVERVKRILDDRRRVRVQLPPWARVAMILGLAALFVGLGIVRVRANNPQLEGLTWQGLYPWTPLPERMRGDEIGTIFSAVRHAISSGQSPNPVLDRIEAEHKGDVDVLVLASYIRALEYWCVIAKAPWAAPPPQRQDLDAAKAADGRLLELARQDPGRYVFFEKCANHFLASCRMLETPSDVEGAKTLLAGLLKSDANSDAVEITLCTVVRLIVKKDGSDACLAYLRQLAEAHPATITAPRCWKEAVWIHFRAKEWEQMSYDCEQEVRTAEQTGAPRITQLFQALAQRDLKEQKRASRPSGGSEPKAEPRPQATGPRPRLEFFIGREMKATEEVSPGDRVFTYEGQSGWRYVWQGKPFLTGDSIQDMQVQRARLPGQHDSIGVTLDAPGAEVLEKVTAASVGKAMVVTLDGEVVQTPIIKARIPGGGCLIELDRLTEAQRGKLLAMAAWIDRQVPKKLPGTGRLKLTARFADGSKPVDSSCEIMSTALMEQQRPSPELVAAEAKRPRPKAVGKDGDWVIYNVTPGQWGLTVSGDDCANSSVYFDFAGPAGRELPITITLSRGATVTGRVLRDDTGLPVARARLRGLNRDGTTDEQGRFTLTHVGWTLRVDLPQGRPDWLPAAGPMKVSLTATDNRDPDLVPFVSDAVQLTEGQSLTLPDIRLLRGGWVVGHVVRPEDAPGGRELYWGITLTSQGFDPKGWRRGGAFASENGQFRFRVPAGRYALEVAEWRGKGPGFGPPRWTGRVEGVTVRAGETTPDITVRVTRAKE